MARSKRISVLAISAIAAALTLGALATASQAALRHFDGTVVSKNAAAKTFKISTQSGTKKTRSTPAPSSSASPVASAA